MADISAKQFGLRKSDLPRSIIEIISTLTKAGFEAYIVGGGVRDNLLDLHPKDFDAVTNAKPYEIKELFGKRCRIIGRRFQLAHVYSGRDMIEVATFRAPPNDDTHTTEEGMITRDNVWGDIKQDFARRDFSINALYYQPITGVIKDFCHAIDDVESKTLRLLGDAKTRIEEDPVRLLRALRFKAKLGFEFDEDLEKQFNADNWALLEQVSHHRLYDETQKMFTGGYIVPLLPLLYEYGAMEHLFIGANQQTSQLVKQIAYNTDKRIAKNQSINPAFFYAGLLWHNYLQQLNKNKKRDMPFLEAQKKAAAKVIKEQRVRTAIPRFAEQFIYNIWLLQPKLANPRAKNILQIAEHPRFRAGYDFLLLRERAGEEDTPLAESTNGMGEWWQHFQTLNEKGQNKLIKQFTAELRSNKGSKSSKNKKEINKEFAKVKSNTSQRAGKNISLATAPITSAISQAQQDSDEKAQLQMLSLDLQSTVLSQDNQHAPVSAFVVDDMGDNSHQDLDDSGACDNSIDDDEADNKIAGNTDSLPKTIQALHIEQEATPLQAILLESKYVPKERRRRKT